MVDYFGKYRCASLFKLHSAYFKCNKKRDHKGMHKFIIEWNDEDAV